METTNETPMPENEVLETRSQAGVSALLNEVDDEDYDTTDVVQDAAQKRKSDAAIAAYQAKLSIARETAFKGVAAVDCGLILVDNRLGLDEIQGSMLTEATAPVLVKYAVEPPEWYKQWGAEMQLAGAMCVVAFLQYKTLIELRKLDAVKAKEALKQGESNGTHQQQ